LPRPARSACHRGEDRAGPARQHEKLVAVAATSRRLQPLSHSRAHDGGQSYGEVGKGCVRCSVIIRCFRSCFRQTRGQSNLLPRHPGAGDPAGGRRRSDRLPLRRRDAAGCHAQHRRHFGYPDPDGLARARYSIDPRRPSGPRCPHRGIPGPRPGHDRRHRRHGSLLHRDRQDVRGILGRRTSRGEGARPRATRVWMISCGPPSGDPDQG
jgi:hypothetical protein